MTRPHRFAMLAAGLVIGGLLAVAAAPSALHVGHFSAATPSDSLPADWSPIQFGDPGAPTTYDLVQVDSTVVVRARSENAASALITRQRVDLGTHPVIEWRWHVGAAVEDGDITKKETDDAAARLYVTFDYEGLGFFDRVKLMLLRNLGYDDLPTRALNYVWANRRSPGEMRPSPYTDQIMMMPVRSDSARVGEWVRERRNVRADYRQAFGEEPPPVDGVAIMTDTDNTGASTQALYGDIVFRTAPSSPEIKRLESDGPPSGEP